MFDRNKISYADDFDVWSKVLINKLKAAGVGGLQFHVNGSGDSPDGEDFCITKDAESAINLANGNGFCYGQPSDTEIDDDLMAEISTFFWDWSDKQWGGGWYNNDGGYMSGAIIVDDPNPRAYVTLWCYPEPEAVQQGEVSL